MQEKRYGKMDKYLLTIMVTFEQEYAIQKLFGRHGWEYSKITDEISLKDFKSGEKSSPEIQPELNQQSCVKKTVASDSSKIVTSNDDKDSSNTPRHETAIPAVKFSMQNDVNNMLDNSINSEADAYHNDEGDGDDDYGGDTDTEQTLMSLGIVVKEELESGDDDDKASEHDVDSINKRSSNVKPSGKGKRSAQSKAETRNKKKRKQATSTVPSAEVEDNVDKGESEVKLEGLSAEDQGTDDPLAVLETLPDIEHVSKVVSSNTHDVETFLTGPDDVDESGYSVSLSLYFCRDCQYTFPEEKYYTLHKRSGKCVFQCQFCDKKYTFKNFSQYQEHLKQHRLITSTDGSVVEPLDGSFLDKSLLGVLVKEAEDPFSCSICAKSYKSKSALKRHLKIHSDKYQCKACTLFFETEEKLISHRDSKHQPHLCVICGNCFSSKSNLDRHMVVHGDTSNAGKVFKCPFENCNKQFSLRASYEAHVNNHSGFKPYQCSQCGHTYSNKYKRNQHEKICSGHVSITCTICQMNFKRKDQLKKHQSAKHSDKRFYCACGKNYSFLFALKRHAKKCTLSIS
ncbi:zinc finger protein 2-like isoform X3 [Mercenaria mercenaria]|uniref:zinc finger protein 2-like isoform X3 n=1 Tax=Mercenaria mercenaria TaxID=6596 RepID=UPI00234E5CB5|nr:zinc finger protein 2-like isoform X3 [Mercenaria mercenaria]